MAHPTGLRDRLARPPRRACRAAANPIVRLVAGNAGRLRGLPMAAMLVVAAGVLVLATGPAGHDPNALAALAAGASAPGAPSTAPPASAPAAAVSASAIDSLAGSAGVDPLDLVGKGVVVAALLYLTLRALRHLQAGPSTGSHRLRVVETRPLGPKASLHLVAVGERRLVVGLSPSGIVSIAELDATELAEPVAVANDLGAPVAVEGAPAGLRTALVACAIAIRQLLRARVTPRLDRVPVAIARRADER
jgi:flagellar biogenesis protein FliO